MPLARFIGLEMVVVEMIKLNRLLKDFRCRRLERDRPAA